MEECKVLELRLGPGPDPAVHCNTVFPRKLVRLTGLAASPILTIRGNSRPEINNMQREADPSPMVTVHDMY